MTSLALRYAWRELRGGLRGFGVFIACIALGVMAISGVGSVAQSLADGLAQAGSAILGGDLNFALVQREATPDERRFLVAHGKVSVVATLPTMARVDDGRTTLVEIKAIDDAYPLFGTVSRIVGTRQRRIRRRRRSGVADAARAETRRPHRHRQSDN
jgi:putative ABC transport system permease protein